jgi:tRNA pseudouridine synthase 10
MSSLVQELVQAILSASKPYEFETFLVGVTNHEPISREEFRKQSHELKVELGTILEHLPAWKERKVSILEPEMHLIVDPLAKTARCQPSPLYIAGRYRKLSRKITSSFWIHNPCQGRGCISCGGRGSVFDFSIEEFLDRVLQPAFKSTGRKFHVMGREDTDVLMLGKGRPFVFQLQNPKKRKKNLSVLLKKLAGDPRVEIPYLTYTDFRSISLLKDTPARKEYVALILSEEALPSDLEKRLEAFQDQTIQQRTPLRVRQRRADIFRVRHIYKTQLEERQGTLFRWRVEAESGTYIKELISGDHGDTSPSLSSHLGLPLTCVELDVAEILWKAPWE